MEEGWLANACACALGMTGVYFDTERFDDT